jgi:hypothetical protein
MPVMGATRFERFFRVAAGLHVDKNDLKRYGEFVDQKLYDLLLAGRATAKANGRDIMQPYDLPITKGLQENLHRFRQIDEEVELAPILEQLAARPPLDVTLADSTERRLPEIVGGLSVALARAFKLVYPDRKNPQTAEWEGIHELFDLLL